jgi:predicted transcriptional regulator
VTDRAQLAAYVAAVLKDEPDGLPCTTIARRLGMRPSTVRAVLRADEWFVRSGETRYARWHLIAGTEGTEAGRKGRSGETPDMLVDVLRRLDALEARLDALERRNGVHA